MTAGAQPYTPNLVPTSVDATNPAKAISDLQRFLQEELQRIEVAMVVVPVQAAYGSLIVETPALDAPLSPVPTTVEAFDAFKPDNTNRVIPDFSPDALTVEEGGVYFMQASISATVDQLTEYKIQITVNGVDTDIIGVLDASNQMFSITLNCYGLRELDAGFVIRLVASADTVGATFIVLAGTLMVVRVSELHGRNASAIP